MKARFPLRVGDAPRAHPGLWFDKYLDQDQKEDEWWGDLLHLPSADGVYKLAYSRWKRHWQTGADTRLCLEGLVSGRLALGLGGEAVFENGLRLHHTYGAPVIPASAIKGVLRRRMPAGKHRDFLFGPDNADSAGFAVFQDAWWVPATGSALAPDAITVHHQNYYDKKAPPTDFDSPNPVHFLTVTGAFLFVAGAPNASWLDYLAKLLQDVLEKDGIGAKRSSGYGRFLFPLLRQ